MEYTSSSASQTKQIAADFAKSLNGKGAIVALFGDLGAGKTTFVQGFAEGLKIQDKIISPTFVLTRQHRIPETDRTLYHIDLYRLDEEKQFNQLGLQDLLHTSEDIVLIEWAEKIEKQLPKDTICIYIEKTSDSIRKITI